MATGPWAPSWKACEWDGGEEGRKDQDTSLAGGWAGPEGASPNTPPCHLQRGAAHGQARAPSVPGGMSPTAAMRPPWPSHPQQPSLLRPRFQSPARGTAHLRGSPGHGAQRSEAGAEGPPPPTSTSSSRNGGTAKQPEGRKSTKGRVRRTGTAWTEMTKKGGPCLGEKEGGSPPGLTSGSRWGGREEPATRGGPSYERTKCQPWPSTLW